MTGQCKPYMVVMCLAGPAALALEMERNGVMKASNGLMDTTTQGMEGKMPWFHQRLRHSNGTDEYFSNLLRQRTFVEIIPLVFQTKAFINLKKHKMAIACCSSRLFPQSERENLAAKVLLMGIDVGAFLVRQSSCSFFCTTRPLH